MDIISHLLIGEILALPSQSNLKDNLIVAAFAVLPDITQLPIYLHIGHVNKRYFWWPKNSDWLHKRFRSRHPAWSALWELPHSFLFLLFVILPIVFCFHLPNMAIVSYFSHIFIDLFTCTGPIKPRGPIGETCSSKAGTNI